MSCYHTLTGYLPIFPDGEGKRRMRFSPSLDKNGEYKKQEVSCGQCVGCRLERARVWAIRCVHEASMYRNNCFITLTFSPEGLHHSYRSKNKYPFNSVDIRDFQLFMKRLRKHTGKKIRYYMCGEYGEKNKRPHYHALLFGFDFSDKELFFISKKGSNVYRSKVLDDIWGMGYTSIGDVNFHSAGYVARYVMKKITGDAALHRYSDIDSSTGEIISEVCPEFNSMSRRPGIGFEWFQKYYPDVVNYDHVIINSFKSRVPRYYDKLLEIQNPHLLDDIKDSRLTKMEKYADNNTPERLIAREHVIKQRIKLLTREV
jgi:hypothetical protein